MDTTKDPNTEDKIIDAAEQVFIEKGMAGARMQEIADRAGINKALLHYYYRSKEKLFSLIFRTAIRTMVPNLIQGYNTEGDFFDRLRNFIGNYLVFIDKHPHIPGFVIHELNSNPTELMTLLAELNINIDFIIEDIKNEIAKGRIKPIEPVHLIVNIISLCIFPVVAKPMITGIFFKGDMKTYQNFMESRKNHVADFIIDSIKTN